MSDKPILKTVLVKLPKDRIEPKPFKTRYIASVRRPEPIEMLNNFESIIMAEIHRLNQTANNETLSMKDTKKLEMLMNTFTKYHKELRETKQASVLQGLSYEEIIQLAQEAIDTLDSVLPDEE